MKVFSFCNSNPSQEKIQKLIELEWFDSGNQWEFLDESLLESIQEGTLGVDQRNIGDLIEYNDVNLVLMERRFAVRSNVIKDAIWFNDNLLVLSTSNMNKNIPNIIQIGLYLYLWPLHNEITCKNDCIFNNFLVDASVSICSDCEDQLCQLGYGKYAVIIRSLLALRNKLPLEINNTLNMHIAEALPVLNLSSMNPQFKIIAAKMIIDYHLRSGTDLRNWLEETSRKAYEQKQEIQKNYKSGRNKFPKFPFFIASRRWNSWTPNLPRNQSDTYPNSHKKNGGGYFISDGEVTIVIDPGYGFLEVLNRFHDISVMDIDAIIITHDHPDHSSELQNILNLRFVYKEECISKLKIFLNPSTFYLYGNLLSYYSKILDEISPKVILPEEDPIIFNRIEINAIGMNHDEIYTHVDTNVKNKVDKTVEDKVDKTVESKALGLKFAIKNIDGAVYQIAIPGDTSFPENAGTVESLAEFYGKPDIASIHLGAALLRRP
jgi:ribonuclease BN (tRNA processing enzyme)